MTIVSSQPRTQPQSETDSESGPQTPLAVGWSESWPKKELGKQHECLSMPCVTHSRQSSYPCQGLNQGLNQCELHTSSLLAYLQNGIGDLEVLVKVRT